MSDRRLNYNDCATHDHVVITVTNDEVGVSFNKRRYNVKEQLWDSGSQFQVSIQEPITQKVWNLIESECPSMDCMDCTDGCVIKKLRELVK